MRPSPSQEEICDVLILGSGAAGLTAALAASAAGCATVILEKTNWIGGTSAISAGGLWIPANRHARTQGVEDSPADALAYIRSLAPPGWQQSEDNLWKSFVNEAPRMLDFVESHSPLRCELTNQNDPYPDRVGAKRRGRMLSPLPMRRGLIGAYAPRLRPPMLPHVFTYQEYLRFDPYRHPISATLKQLPQILVRLLVQARAMGTALITGLLKGCLDHGCRLKLDSRAVELIANREGAIVGVAFECNGEKRHIYSRRGVVLATGGFEWDAEMVARHFPGPVDFITSPRSNEGDGHRMAERAGAAMAHMDQANLSPAMPVIYQGQAQGISLAFHRAPNAILVDRNGRRFVNEFQFNIGEVLDARDPTTARPHFLPAWLVTDSRFLKRSPMAQWFARYDKDWVVRGHSIMDLARHIVIPEEALASTIARFNAFCAAGVDEDFHREAGGPFSGGDALAPISKPPFLAMPFNRSFISTKGGPRTNERGEVLRPDRTVIEGLCCAGVAMANPIGTWAVGAGTTLGPNMTWGFISGQRLAARTPITMQELAHDDRAK